MDAKQVELLKETHMASVENVDGTKTTAGGYVRFCLDGGVDFVTSKDFVIFDDSNNLLHCIAMNEDVHSQADYPVKVISSDYGVIQQIESIYSRKNFENILSNGFLSSVVSEEKKQMLLTWARSIKNAAIQPSRPTPYYSTEPKVIPMGSSTMPRKDGITHTSDSSSSTAIKVAACKEDVAKLLESSKAGDVIMIDKAVVFDEDTTIKANNVLLISNGAAINAGLTIEGSGVGMSGFIINSSNEDTEIKTGTAMVKVTGDDFTMTSCVIRPNGKYYNAINLKAKNATIKGNTFENSSEGLYNAIEFSQDKNYSVKNIDIEDNYFARGSCTNNSISMYQFEDNAVVNIKNNIWDYSSNALRISNYSNSKDVTINCIGNIYRDTTDGDYAGFMLAQGVKGEDFSTINVNFINLIGPNGYKVMENNVDGKHVWYTYNTESAPVVNFH